MTKKDNKPVAQHNPIKNEQTRKRPTNHAIKYGSQKGAMKSEMNLVCSEGHEWHAPRPEFFVDRKCLHKGDGHTCQGILALLP